MCQLQRNCSFFVFYGNVYSNANVTHALESNLFSQVKHQHIDANNLIYSLNVHPRPPLIMAFHL